MVQFRPQLDMYQSSALMILSWYIIKTNILRFLIQGKTLMILTGINGSITPSINAAVIPSLRELIAISP